jgi:hypothetical protein
VPGKKRFDNAKRVDHKPTKYPSKLDTYLCHYSGKVLTGRRGSKVYTKWMSKDSLSTGVQQIHNCKNQRCEFATLPKIKKMREPALEKMRYKLLRKSREEHSMAISDRLEVMLKNPPQAAKITGDDPAIASPNLKTRPGESILYYGPKRICIGCFSLIAAVSKRSASPVSRCMQVHVLCLTVSDSVCMYARVTSVCYHCELPPYVTSVCYHTVCLTCLRLLPLMT